MTYKCKFCEAEYDIHELTELGFEDLMECPECGEIDPFEEVDE